VSADPAVSYTQGLLLLNQGCEVETAFCKSYAQELIQSHSFDVLVFGSSVTPEASREWRRVFASEIRKVRLSKWLLRIGTFPMNEPDATGVGPEELIAASSGRSREHYPITGSP
jgi:hypothetical protein